MVPEMLILYGFCDVVGVVVGGIGDSRSWMSSSLLSRSFTFVAEFVFIVAFFVVNVFFVFLQVFFALFYFVLIVKLVQFR